MRLTKRNADGIACSANPFMISTFAIVDKLAEYEDTGLSPEDFKEKTEGVLELYEKLKPYADAEEQGRLVILPCKVGDILFWLDKGATTHEIVECRVNEFRIDYYGPFVVLDKVASPEYRWRAAYIELIGKKLFLTREEAEAALNGGHDDGP